MQERATIISKFSKFSKYSKFIIIWKLVCFQYLLKFLGNICHTTSIWILTPFAMPC